MAEFWLGLMLIVFVAAGLGLDQERAEVDALDAKIEELCAKDVPSLLAELRRLRAENAYLGSVLAAGGGDESLRAALRKIVRVDGADRDRESAERQKTIAARSLFGCCPSLALMARSTPIRR